MYEKFTIVDILGDRVYDGVGTFSSVLQLDAKEVFNFLVEETNFGEHVEINLSELSLKLTVYLWKWEKAYFCSVILILFAQTPFKLRKYVLS